MKNNKFIPGASKAEEKGKKNQKEKRKPFRIFFRQVSTKEESKGFPKQRKNG
jgi:hypothetical protein